MKILLIGHSGTIGKCVFKELQTIENIEVITASRSSGEYSVDLENLDSIKSLFEAIGKIDAIVITSGTTVFLPFDELSPEENLKSINNKLLGQINTVLIGHKYLNDGGSITLTSGIIHDEFINTGTSSAMVNGALKAFVQSSAFEIGRNIRINAVSPGPITESWEGYQSFFKGFVPVDGKKVAQSYLKSILGIMTGQIFKVY